MGKTRQSANLVSKGNIFSDVTHSRVGIQSSSPASALDVAGDINFSGTLYQDGVEFSSGAGGTWTSSPTGIHTTKNVGIGTTNPRFSLEVGAVGASGTTLYVNGDARVTGILTVGTASITIDPTDNAIKLSEDTIIRRDDSTGDIRFLDASDNLKKIIANEIRIGTGSSVSIIKGSTSGKLKIQDSTGTETELSSGGGGSSLTTHDDESKSNESGWNGNTTYSCCARAAGGKKGNSFFFARLEQNSSSTDTRLRIYSFTVNRSTGAITWGSESNVWYNSSGSGYSTTFWASVDGTGSIFSGGHNQYPGYSSHVFGYSKFLVNENGTISGATYSYTNADHGYNGQFYSLPTAENSGYMITGGYNANASSRAYYRKHSVSGTSISVGGLNSLSSDTSTTYSVNMIAQPGVYQSGNQVCSMLYYRTSSSAYYVKTVAANGNVSQVSVSAWDSNAFAFQMTNGDVILYSDAHTPMKFTAYNSASTMSSASSWPGGNMYYGFAHFGLGSNEFVLCLDSSSVLSFGKPLVKATLDGTTGFTITATADIPALVSVGMESSYTGMYPLYASESDASPDKMLFVRHQSDSIRAKVTDFPTFS